MVSKRYKRKKSGHDFIKGFLFLLLLIVGAAAGFLYHSNKQMTGELARLRRETSHLRSELKKKEAEIAELKIQAVIKDSSYKK